MLTTIDPAVLPKRQGQESLDLGLPPTPACWGTDDLIDMRRIIHLKIQSIWGSHLDWIRNLDSRCWSPDHGRPNDKPWADCLFSGFNRHWDWIRVPTYARSAAGSLFPSTACSSNVKSKLHPILRRSCWAGSVFSHPGKRAERIFA